MAISRHCASTTFVCSDRRELSSRRLRRERGKLLAAVFPTFTLHGNLVHFGAFKDHISFFPTASGVAAFKKVLGKYKVAKGTIQFPLDKPLPTALIRKIVSFRVKEQAKREAKVRR